ncbi:hypothetical protein ACTZGP_16420 [Pseudomonas putida]|uniref:hypothetical protein n=1 Tax=Pseudomonas putida TaxID=303 RepID=UPI003FD28C69
MKSPKVEAFGKPSLHNTASPTIITYAEYEDEKSGVTARYPGKKGDLIMIYFIADIGYPSLETRTLTTDRFEFLRLIGTATEWEIVGKKIHAFFTVIRDSKLLGFSEMFIFEILDK